MSSCRGKGFCWKRRSVCVCLCGSVRQSKPKRVEDGSPKVVLLRDGGVIGSKHAGNGGLRRYLCVSPHDASSPLEDCFADQWTLPTTIPNGSFAHVQLNHELYFLGGRREGNFNMLNRVTSYNCMTDGTPTLARKRTLCAAALLNQHEFVVVGGWTGDKDKDKFTYLYNAKTK